MSDTAMTWRKLWVGSYRPTQVCDTMLWYRLPLWQHTGCSKNTLLRPGSTMHVTLHHACYTCQNAAHEESFLTRHTLLSQVHPQHPFTLAACTGRSKYSKATPYT